MPVRRVPLQTPYSYRPARRVSPGRYYLFAPIYQRRSNKTEATPRILLVLWLALFLLFGLQVVGRFSDYLLPTGCLFVGLPLGVLLLAVASNMAKRIVAAPRILVGSWLALFLLFGLEDVRRTVSWVSHSPLVGYVVVGLPICLVLLVVASKPASILGAIKLTVYTGFFIVFANYVIDLVHGSSWLSMADRLERYDWYTEWWGFAFWWYFTPDWVRLVTYLGLGYVVARHRGLLLGIASSILVALADSTLSWLVLILNAVLSWLLGFSYLWEAFQVLWPEIWPEIVRALLIQAGILAFFGLVGALITRVRWPKSITGGRWPKSFQGPGHQLITRVRGHLSSEVPRHRWLLFSICVISLLAVSSVLFGLVPLSNSR